MRLGTAGLLLAASLLASCSLALRPPAPPEPTYARFDWFEYVGHDSVFDRVEHGPGTYLNPILAGFHPDPSIVRAGDDYYLVTSSFSYFPGVPIFHSRDLVHWTQIGHVLDRPSQLALDSLEISEGIFAPTIRYHAGTFYMITTLVGGGGNFLVTARDPAGPWSDPVWLPDVDGIDPSLFFDDDGRAWVVNDGPPIGPPLYDGHRAIWLQEYDWRSGHMTGARTLLVNGGVDLTRHPIWIEGPHLYRVGHEYFLMCAEGGTGDQHSEVIFRSDSVRGPYTPWQGNPILTQRQLDPQRPFPVTSTGHADLVQTQRGDWWAVFLGTRPYGDDLYNTGRETFLLPVRWLDGWPVITGTRDTVPYAHARPALPDAGDSAAPTTGNHAIRDEFDRPSLSPAWNFIRTPRQQWYDLTSRPGWLTLRARTASIGDRDQPSFVGRRQEHATASVSTAMEYVPVREGDAAGLVAFQNEEYYYFLAVARSSGATVVELVERAGERTGGEPRVIASAPLTLADGGVTYLRIQARGGSYDFYYGSRPGEWVLLTDGADGTILSTKVAGGFVGTYFGMYAHAADVARPPR